MKTRKLAALLLAVLMLLSLLTACGSGSSGATSGGSETSAATSGCSETADADSSDSAAVETGSDAYTVVTIGVDADLADCSPYGAQGGARAYYYRIIYEFLAQRTSFGAVLEDMELQCAKSITTEDNLTYHVEMYDYIYDAAGNHITAADFEWSANKMIELATYPKVNSYVESVTATGDYTLDITLTAVELGAIEYVVSIIPVISRQAYEDSGDGMATRPVTTASYQLTDYTSGYGMTLTANENYWQTDDSLRYSGSYTNVDQIDYRVITEAAQMSIALQTGTIDVAQCLDSSIIPEFYNDGVTTEGYSILEVVGGTAANVCFNCDPTSVLGDNVALRQAVLYAINNEDVRLAFCGAYGYELQAFAPLVASDYVSAWNDRDYYGYDVDKAKELLAEAGYEAGEVSITLMCRNVPSFVTAAQVIQAELGEIGINVTLFTPEDALYDTCCADPTQYDMWFDLSGCDDFCTFPWGLIFDNRSFSSGTTKNLISDPELQAAFEAASAVETHGEETVAAFEQILDDNAYGYGLFGLYQYYCANSEKIAGLYYIDGQSLVPGCFVYTDAFLNGELG